MVVNTQTLGDYAHKEMEKEAGSVEKYYEKYPQAKKLIEEVEERKKNQELDEEAIKEFTRHKQARNFIKKQPLFYDRAGLWWLWDKEEYYYRVVDETDILNSLSRNTILNTVESKEKNEILEALKQVGRMHEPKPIERTWIQFKDTIVDIKTGERRKATPEYFVTNPIPHKLNEENYENTPIIDKIFTEWVGTEKKDLLYQILAYCLIPDYPIHRIFCFIGGGMNGKSKFLELIRRFVGIKNCTTSELDTLLLSRFEISRLHKKLVCLMGETNFNEMNKTSMLKKLSGGDLIGFEYKRKDPFEDINYAKILISTNNLPTTTDKTIGFYRRWHIVDFPNQFSEKCDVLNQVTEEEYESLCLKSLIILKELLEKREFLYEGSIEERQKKYEEHSDPIEKFMKENCDVTIPDAWISKHEFEKTLNSWLKENRHREVSDRTISKKMQERSIEDGKVYIDDYTGSSITGKKQIRVWYGVRWVNKEVL